MDWIIEMYAKDHPDEIRFVRTKKVQEQLNNIAAKNAWLDLNTKDAMSRIYPKGRPVLPAEWKFPVD